jgi:hypothetical protein
MILTSGMVIVLVLVGVVIGLIPWWLGFGLIAPAIGTALFIASDFDRHNWAKWCDPKGRLDRVPYSDQLGGWMAGALIWWPVALVGYLIDRRYAPPRDLP